jgi:hypothetical protein
VTDEGLGRWADALSAGAVDAEAFFDHVEASVDTSIPRSDTSATNVVRLVRGTPLTGS